MQTIQWHEIVSWANKELEAARTKNDSDLDAVTTAKLRGRIETLKELIALPSTKRILEAQSRFVTQPAEDA